MAAYSLETQRCFIFLIMLLCSCMSSRVYLHLSEQERGKDQERCILCMMGIRIWSQESLMHWPLPTGREETVYHWAALAPQTRQDSDLCSVFCVHLHYCQIAGWALLSFNSERSWKTDMRNNPMSFSHHGLILGSPHPTQHHPYIS